MADSSDLAEAEPEAETKTRTSRRRTVVRAALASAGILAVALGTGWALRERIADSLIDRELASLGLPARYHVESIELGREVLSGISIGDPRHPDLTIERAEVALRYGFSGPRIDRITLVRPRLFGALRDGHLGFGSLDRVIYAPSSGKPATLPDWSVTLVDGRGRIDSPWGPLAFSADGAGRLSDGFSGTLGAVVPSVNAGRCTLARTTLYAAVAVHGGHPLVQGPLRFGAGHCGDTTFAAGKVDFTASSDRTFSDWSFGGKLGAGRIANGDAFALAGLGGDIGLRWSKGRNELAGRVTLAARGVAAPSFRMDSLRLDGLVHARNGYSSLDFRGDLDGRGLVHGATVAAALEKARLSTEGTPVGPLVARFGSALALEEKGSRLTGSVSVRQDAAGWRVVVPSLELRGGHSGQSLAVVSRLAVDGQDGHIPHMVGNFMTGGQDLPRITGTMASGSLASGKDGGARFRLTMADYAAGGARLALPGLSVAQAGDGSLGFAGTVAMSGPISGGRVENLVLPVEGGLDGDGHLALLRRCVMPRFDRMQVGTLDLGRSTITLCPTNGAVVRAGGGAAPTIAATLPRLDLAGRNGGAPFELHAGAGRIAWPGTSTLAGLDLALGRGEDANRLRLGTLTATSAGQGGGFEGSFAGADARLAVVPMTMSEMAGGWHFADGKLALSSVAFKLSDRQSPARYAPLAGRDGSLMLADGAVHADAHLIAPKNGAEVGRVVLRHDLASAVGHADFTVPGLTFVDGGKDAKGPTLQPSDLSDMAKGVIANADGTIKGNGRIDWTAKGVTATGAFGSDDLDFAAAFGPVKGLSGTMVFTDLVHLVTAPHQVFKVASVNPGIEVDNGTVDLQLLAGQVVRLNGAQWPFEGGTLKLEPVDLNMAVAEPRHYNLVITALDAGRFLQHMNMSNISATGTFDGRLPLVFDANGGRITGGTLVSRPPGGNVSYVGALTYKDLTTMANYAFRMLRSIDYTAMNIGMQGDLSGEVVTRVSFSGVKQGAKAERNFLTRQLGALPIRFDVNIRAQFYQLINSLRSLYDPTMVRDPRELGLVDQTGHVIQRRAAASTRPVQPASLSRTTTSDEGAIQTQASGTMP
ncbi:hypothetical protein Y88_1219 [Novosphingobium nitrogenifigens DSM 19370]|uniref:Uncharacterized protein n=1 Tax=Novosphingobium nitrogenifigens DSM 19370 TaxID=983920 RepID=F1Z868_9SPHN|nr:YdbH domain-containing protein [Novosphingobium nitrogenifigens]EGD59157.1 hypothetical protein Y88_1219 [Novosphingobium nitrogenifigens DSM 19370]